ncbi:MAG TPA: proprotein convertase P-domain-containing protein [Myxococcota bacterium]|nr:proprotein convertase P-domain-containing protein [Myxococcota bacterium]
MKLTATIPVTLLLALTTACADEAVGPALAPDLAEGKADAGDKVTKKGALGLGADLAVSASFTEDLEFHGFELTLGEGADVRIEVTQKGTTRGLDTTMYVYGPRDTATGAFGTTAKAFDDDAGYGKLSLLKSMKAASGGTFLVVIGTRDGRGRGNYRLEARCNNDRCAPPVEPEAACHPEFKAAIADCVTDWQADPDYDDSVLSAWDLTYQCADVEPLAPVRDALCEGGQYGFCALEMEDFATGYVAGCRTEALHALLDETCVFGQRYRDLFGEAEAMVVIGQATFEQGAGLSALQKEQIVAAVKQTAYDDVSTVDEAFEAVDEGLVHMAELWDASNRKAYTVYEVGAGDNSFGAIFVQGATSTAATINDGDIYGCGTFWGPERRRCEADSDCLGGTRCHGRSEASPLGRCVAADKDDHPAHSQSCSLDGAASGDFGCPAGSGLLCAGAALSGEGLCLPAWMRGRFDSEPAVAIPDNKANGVEAQLLAYGLATVDMDVKIDLHVSHPRPADLRITLTNPSGNEVSVFDGATDGAGRSEVYLRGHALRGFSGDESVNGVWRLKAVDSKSGQTGTLYSFGLEITSRWD